MSNCDVCGKLIQKLEQINCTNCDNIYHYLCVNMTVTKYKRLSRIARSTWNCPSCLNDKQDKEATSGVAGHNSDDEEKDSDIRRIIRDEIRNTMRTEVKNLIRELRNEIEDIKQQFEELKSSGCFDISQYNELKSEFTKLKDENVHLRSQNSVLQATTDQLRNQVNIMDQNLRDANLEIHGLPENKNEVLPSILTQLSRVVSHELSDSDIMKCTRVASISNNKTRPRTVVVKLRSPRCRDELYSAITRYNKAHKDEKLNTALLGYGGNKRPIYVSEHLSPTYKSLHAAARLRAKEKSYKFVWVRYGKIYVAKNEYSGNILIKGKECLDKIV